MLIQNRVVQTQRIIAYAYWAISAISLGVIILCLLYTSDAADERSSVDLGGRRIIKKKHSSDLSARLLFILVMRTL